MFDEPHEVFEQEQFIPRPLDEVFPFFERPENLEIITPPWVRFQVLTPSPVPMHEGAEITYKLKLHGVPVRWKTRIEAYDPPNLFIDRQVRGPYALWHHTHEFEPTDNGTLMRDTVRYRLPLGPFGYLAHKLFVRRDVEQIFGYRKEAIERQLGEAASAGRTAHAPLSA